jgi:hypothetical protein
MSKLRRDVTEVPYHPLIIILDYIHNLNDILNLSILTKSKWRLNLPNQDGEIWLQIARMFNIRIQYSPYKFVTRSRQNYKQTFLKEYRKKLFNIRDRHEQLMLHAKYFFEVSSRDRPRQLQSLILNYFPNFDDYDVNYQSVELEGNTMLTLASRGVQRLKCVALLINKFHADVNLPEIGGFTPLILAAYYDNETNVRLLIKNHANVHAVAKVTTLPKTCRNFETVILFECSIRSDRSGSIS